MLKRYFSWLALVWVCASVAQVKVQAPLPARTLSIEIRQVEEGREAADSYRAGPADAARDLPPMALVVRNGEKGSLRLQQTVPMQWVQSAQSQSSTLTLPTAAASSSGGGVSQALHWFDVGSSLTVMPRWLGGKKEVSLDLEVLQADMQMAPHADLPRQVRNQTHTSVLVPLGQWVTIAASGRGPSPAGSYSSEVRTDARRLLQVRVSLP